MRSYSSAAGVWILCGVVLLASCRRQNEPETHTDATKRTQTTTPEVVENDAPVAPRWDLSVDATASRLRHAIEWMASDERGGRGPYSPGLNQTAEYLRKQFDSTLSSDQESQTEFQEFMRRERWQTEIIRPLSILGHNASETSFVPDREFLVQPGSASGEYSLPLVFAGYGISAPELEYDDYLDLDVEGKAVIVLRHEPELYNKSSRFNGDKLSQHGSLYRKIEVAAEKGAAMLIFVEDAAHLEYQSSRGRGDTDRFAELDGDRVEPAAIPVIQIKRNLFSEWVKRECGTALDEFEAEIDRTMAPATVDLGAASVTVELRCDKSLQTHKNVIAAIPGAGSLANQTVVLGAHYDHVGRGAFGSLAPWTNEIHNGADDNASGTAALVEIARRLQTRIGETSTEEQPRRRIVFIAFAAEEMGLLGSRFYCRSPRYELNTTSAMLNLDMVGRMRGDDKVEVFGTGTASFFESLVQTSFDNQDLVLVSHPEGYGPSDHESFHLKGIPVLHFFTGYHPDYHRPSDDPQHINYEGLARLIASVDEIAWQLATQSTDDLGERDQTAQLDPGPQDGPDNGKQPQWSSDALGIDCELRTDVQRMQITNVEKLSPADRAQLRAGDVIIRVNEQQIDTEASLESAFEEAEQLSIVIQRGDLQLQVTIQQ